MFTVQELGKIYRITIRQVEFYMLVGLCIKEWAKVEDELFRICEFALNAEPQLASIVYFRTPNIDARLTLADELLRVVLSERDGTKLQIWTEIRKEIETLLPTRNLLAHAPVRQELYPDTPDDPALRIEVGPDGIKRQILRSVEVMWVETSEHERLRGKGERSIVDAALSHHLTSVQAAAAKLGTFHAAQIAARTTIDQR
jgi:hypothetical protein